MARNTFKSMIWWGLTGAMITGMAPAAMAHSRPILVERIVARINNKIITQRQYNKKRQDLREQLAQQYSGAKLHQEFQEQSKNLIRDMIDEDLLVQKAQDDDISVDTDVIKRLDEIRQHYHLPTLEALQQAVEKSGMDWQDYKNQIKRQLLMRQVISQEVGSRIILTRADARKYFDAHRKEFDSPPGVHLAEILVSTSKHSPSQALKLVKQAMAEIQNGAHFSDVAKKYSDSPSAQDGGDIGFFKKGSIAPNLATVIANIDTGDVSKIIKTQYGYVIFKVIEKQEGKTPTFNQVANQVMGILYDQRIKAALRGFLTKLREESYIRLAPGFVDTGAPPGYNESY